MTENDRPNPIAVYDVAKLASEAWALTTSTNMAGFAAFRFATNYGPGKLGRLGAANHLWMQCVLIESHSLGGRYASRAPVNKEKT